MAQVQLLNVQMIERLEEPDKYGDEHSLRLHVTNIKTKSWLFICRCFGQDGMRGLGSYCNVNFEEVWKKTGEFAVFLGQVNDPGRHAKELIASPNHKCTA